MWWTHFVIVLYFFIGFINILSNMSLCNSLVGGIKNLNRNFYHKIDKCNVLLAKTYSTRDLLKEAYCRTKLKCRCKYLHYSFLSIRAINNNLKPNILIYCYFIDCPFKSLLNIFLKMLLYLLLYLTCCKH